MANEQQQIVPMRDELLYFESGDSLIILRPLTTGSLTTDEVSLYQVLAVIPSLPATTSDNSVSNCLGSSPSQREDDGTTDVNVQRPDAPVSSQRGDDVTTVAKVAGSNALAMMPRLEQNWNQLILAPAVMNALQTTGSFIYELWDFLSRLALRMLPVLLRISVIAFVLSLAREMLSEVLLTLNDILSLVFRIILVFLTLRFLLPLAFAILWMFQPNPVFIDRRYVSNVPRIVGGAGIPALTWRDYDEDSVDKDF